MPTKRFYRATITGPTEITITPPAKAIRVCNDNGAAVELGVKIPAVGGDDVDTLLAGEKELYKDPTGGISSVTLSPSASCAVRLRVIEGNAGGGD